MMAGGSLEGDFIRQTARSKSLRWITSRMAPMSAILAICHLDRQKRSACAPAICGRVRKGTIPVINEVPSAALEAYATSFPGPHMAMVVASIGAGNTEARLWVAAQPASGAVVLLW